MNRQGAINIMERRGFTLGAQMTDNETGGITYLFHSQPVYKGDTIVLPPINCAVYPDTNEFKFVYAIPDTINKLVSERCSSFDAVRHFDYMRSKFEHNVKMLHKALVEEIIAKGQTVTFLNQLEQQDD